ncbi:MAG: hypothetical protein AB7F59_13910 [Bdellovibrionales bacterium]
MKKEVLFSLILSSAFSYAALAQQSFFSQHTPRPTVVGRHGEVVNCTEVKHGWASCWAWNHLSKKWNYGTQDCHYTDCSMKLPPM